MSEKTPRYGEYTRPLPDTISQWIRVLQPRARTSIRTRVVHPWGFRLDVQDEAIVHQFESGGGVFKSENTEFPLSAGDMVIVIGGPAYTLTSAHEITAEDKFPYALVTSSEPPASADATDIVTTMFRLGINPHSRLRRLIPQVMHVPGDRGHLPEWIALLESVADVTGVWTENGASDIADQLSQLAFTLALRTYYKAKHQAIGMDLSGKYHRLLDLVFEVRAHPSVPWSVDRMAARVTLSRSAFYDLFLKILAEPPMEYVTRVRMALAADLLTTTDLAPCEIAEATGYGSAASLIRAFNRYHGVTLAEYRNRARAE